MKLLPLISALLLLSLGGHEAKSPPEPTKDPIILAKLSEFGDFNLIVNMPQKCFFWVNRESTWDESKKICEDAGMCLAGFANTEESDCVYDYTPNAEFWTGGELKAQLNNFRWISSNASIEGHQYSRDNWTTDPLALSFVSISTSHCPKCLYENKKGTLFKPLCVLYK